MNYKIEQIRDNYGHLVLAVMRVGGKSFDGGISSINFAAHNMAAAIACKERLEAKLISEEAWKLWSGVNGQDETPQRWVKRVKEKGGTHTSSGSNSNERESKDVSKVGTGNEAMSKTVPTSCAKTMGQQ